MPAKQPVAIVFDTFGTIVDWRGSLIADLSAYLSLIHISEPTRP